MIAIGIFGLWLAQTAFRSGPLAISLPLIDVGEPLVASVVAVMAFGERLGSLSPAMSTGLALAAGITAAASCSSITRRLYRPPSATHPVRGGGA